MFACISCGKYSHRISWSRHKKGSSGATEWPLRAQITKRTQHPNLHVYKNKRYCTKCIRIVKSASQASFQPVPVTEETVAAV